MDELAEQLADARRDALTHESKADPKRAAKAWLRASKLMDRFAVRATTAEAAARKKKASEYRQHAEDLLAGRVTLAPRGAATQTSSEAAGASAARWLVETSSDLSLADVAGLEAVKEQLRQMVLLPLAKPDLAREYGVSVGGGLLMYGPPGTGKTLIARALAGELQVRYFYVSAATLLSKWVSEAEQNVAELFAEARRMSPAVIFIDELEALAGSRNQPDTSGVMRRLLTQLLQEMDGFKGRPEKLLVLGATNRPWDIDEAALRPGRFDALLYVPLPDEPARRQILELSMRRRPTTPNLDLEALARHLEGWSGADLTGLCDQVARSRFQWAATGTTSGEAKQISMEDFETVIRRTRPSVSQAMLAAFEQWSGRR